MSRGRRRQVGSAARRRPFARHRGGPARVARVACCARHNCRCCSACHGCTARGTAAPACTPDTRLTSRQPLLVNTSPQAPGPRPTASTGTPPAALPQRTRAPAHSAPPSAQYQYGTPPPPPPLPQPPPVRHRSPICSPAQSSPPSAPPAGGPAPPAPPPRGRRCSETWTRAPGSCRLCNRWRASEDGGGGMGGWWAWRQRGQRWGRKAAHHQLATQPAGRSRRSRAQQGAPSLPPAPAPGAECPQETAPVREREVQWAQVRRGRAQPRGPKETQASLRVAAACRQQPWISPPLPLAVAFSARARFAPGSPGSAMAGP